MTLRFPSVRMVLTDIEGTVAPISFVRETLFPYAREHVPAFMARNAARADVAEALKEAAAAAGVDDAAALVGVLRQWIDEDRKLKPLKTLQGLIWEEGYRHGDLRAIVFADAVDALRSWHGRGLGLAVYSSGSVLAQKLFFGATNAGDLLPLFGAFFDTAIGGKKEAASYRGIAEALNQPAQAILFLSDTEAELDAAAAAGMAVAQLVRAGEGVVPSTRHPHVSSFAEIEL